jgi:hypothetical protein
MDQDRNVRELIADTAGKAAAKAEAKGLSKERAAEVRTELQAKGEKVLEGSAETARHIVAGARHNQTRLAGAAVAVVAVVLAGWRFVVRRRRRKNG